MRTKRLGSVRVVTLLLWAAALLVTSGCSERTVSSDAEPPGGDARVDIGVGRVDVGVAPEDVSVTPDLPPWQPAGSKDVDILYVIDNSGSMGEEQISLVRSTDASLFEALRSPSFGSDGSGKPCSSASRSGCRIPNLHVGVITTDLGAGAYGLPSCEKQGGDAGRLQNKPRVAGCQPPADAFIKYLEGKTNIPGAQDGVRAVKDAFSCIARVGTAGCGFEQTLESARRALMPGTNPNFLRKGALLAVIFVTDEDDCSAQKSLLYDPAQQALTDPLGPLTSFRCFEFGIQCDINDRNKIGPRRNCVPAQDWLYQVDSYIKFFKGLQPPGGVIMAAIAGPTDRVSVSKDGNNPVLEPSCQSAAGRAVPGIRLKAVVDAFGADGQFTSVCEASYGPALGALAKKVLAKLGAK